MLALLAASAGAEPLSLPEAVSLALQKNAALRAADQAVQAADYNVRSSYGKFLPQIGVEGRYTRTNAPIAIDLRDMRSALIAADVATLQASGANPLIIAGFRTSLDRALPSFSLRVQEEGYYNATASLVQPLFTGGRLIANTKAKKADLAVAREQYRIARNKAVVDAVTGYCRMQLMQDIVAIRRETVEGIREHQRNAENLLGEGLISKASKMRTDVVLAEAQREYDKALRDQELALILLNNALGTDAGGRTLVTPLAQPGPLGGIARYLAAGQATNPNLRLLADTKQLLQQKYNGTRANFLPQVAAYGRYELDREYLTILEPEWAAGIAARINLFNGASDRNDLQATRREIAAVTLLTENAARLVETEIRRYYHDVETARGQYESLQVSRDLADENLRLNRLSFAEGVAPVVDVIDAQLALGKVKAEQSKALNDYAVALVNLTGASGDALDFVALYAAVQK
jgi:outer membrane protein TolC